MSKKNIIVTRYYESGRSLQETLKKKGIEADIYIVGNGTDKLKGSIYTSLIIDEFVAYDQLEELLKLSELRTTNKYLYEF